MTKLFSALFGGKEVRILILGLDNAGKTTILYRLQADEIEQTVPTIGFNVETVQYKNIKFQVWDLGGQTSIRPYWRCYYPNTDAIIYVVDSADTDRLNIAKQELHAMLEVRMVTFFSSHQKIKILQLLTGRRVKGCHTPSLCKQTRSKRRIESSTGWW